MAHGDDLLGDRHVDTVPRARSSTLGELFTPSATMSSPTSERRARSVVGLSTLAHRPSRRATPERRRLRACPKVRRRGVGCARTGQVVPRRPSAGSPDWLPADERERLARWMAERVLAAVHPLPMFVACDDERVAEWAEALGAQVSWGPGLGLNGAIDHGVDTIAGQGHRPRRSSPTVTSRLPDGLPTSPARADRDRSRPAPRRHQRVEPTDRDRDPRRVRSRQLRPPPRRRPRVAARRSASGATPRLSIDVDTIADCRHPDVAPLLRSAGIAIDGGPLDVSANEPGQPRPSAIDPRRASTRARRPGIALADRRPSRRRRVRLRRRRSPSGRAAGCIVHHLVLHGRVEGHVGRRRRHRGARPAPRGRAARGGPPARRRPRRLGRLPALRRRRARR